MLLLCLTGVAAAASRGAVVIGNAQGHCYALDANHNKPAQVLKVGDRFAHNTHFVTGEDGLLVLLFSNGSTLTLKPKSHVFVEEYLHARHHPISASLAGLDREEGVSHTQIHLREGDIVGSVKKLNRDAGSKFNIYSGPYTAGIRGTRWWMLLRVDEQRNLKWGFGIAEGSGVVQSTPEDAQELGAERVLNLTAKIDSKGNIVDADISAGAMPSRQYQAIRKATTLAESLFESFDNQHFLLLE